MLLLQLSVLGLQRKYINTWTKYSTVSAREVHVKIAFCNFSELTL